MVPINQPLLDGLTREFGDAVTDIQSEVGDSWLEVAPDRLVDVCRFLKNDPHYQMDTLNLISGVDYLQTNPKKAAKTKWEPHLEAVYHFSSTTKNHTLVLKLKLPRWRDGRAGVLPEVPSLTGLWRTADWHEREVYDLVGIRFTGHPGLSRILCPEDWDGHPLRKDYKFPDEYHGIRSPGSESP